MLFFAPVLHFFAAPPFLPIQKGGLGGGDFVPCCGLLTPRSAFLPSQEWLIENRALWQWIKRAVGYQSSSRYKQLQRALQEDSAWPPSNRTDVSSSTVVPLEGLGPAYSNPAFVSHEQPCHKR